MKRLFKNKNRLLGLILLIGSAVPIATSAQQKAVSSDSLYYAALRASKEENTYAKAIQLCKQGLAISPDYTDIRLLLGSLYRRISQPDSALVQYNAVLAKNSTNKEALTGMARSYLLKKDYNKAAEYYNILAQHDPEQGANRFQVANMKLLAGDTARALDMIADLIDEFPANQRFKDALPYYTHLWGRQLQKNGQWDKALAAYHQGHEKAPTDTLMLYGLVGGYMHEQNYDSAVKYSDEGLVLDSTNTFFMKQKIGALTGLNRYQEAYTQVQHYLRIHPDAKGMKAEASVLKNKLARNQIGIIHLQSIYDNHTAPASITTLQYLRRFNDGSSLIGQFSYGHRHFGGGFQWGLKSYIMHGPKYYSFALADWSPDKVFPQWRLGYSLFHNFPQGWEGDLGVRLLRTEGITTTSPTASVGKYWLNEWTNLRGYLIFDAGQTHQSYRLSHRHYLNDRNDYLSVILGIGSAPDDRSRNFEYNSMLSFISQSVAVGYQKTFGTRTTVSLFGAWNHYKVSETRHMNQWDIYITILRNF